MDLESIFNEDKIRFNFCSQPGDSVQLKLFDYSWFFNETIEYFHEKDTIIDVFGNNVLSAEFSKETQNDFYETKLAEGFGLIEQYGVDKNANHWETSLVLKGCVIDGVVYGDTSLVVSVEDKENNLPQEFSLSQNYPNPFNPSTKIKFNIPSVGDAYYVSPTNTLLKVYDILGREIKTLINKPMQKGEYEIEFDGSDLPSGIYFYRLCSGKFNQTKKMIYIK